MKKLILLFSILYSLFSIHCNAQWHSQNSYTGENLKSVYFKDNNNGWAVGENGTILNTTNGGSEWTSQNSGTAQTLRSVSNGCIVGDSAKIYKYDGTKWVPVVLKITYKHPFTYYSARFADTTGWIVGGNINNVSGRIDKYNGSSWVGSAFPIAVVPLAVYYTDMNHAWLIVLYKGSNIILRTENGGYNWAGQNIRNETYTKLNSLCILNANNGWCVGDSGNMLKYSGDSVWVNQPNSFKDAYYSVYFPNANNGWVVGEKGRIEKYNGAQWSVQNSNVNYTLRSVYFTDANNGWAVGDHGTILHTTNGGGTGINELGITNYKLGIEVYPNPFKEHSVISYHLKENCNVNLKIFDITGKEIKTLVNEQQQKGNYKVTLNADNLNNGIYFYKIMAGNQTYSNKIVLIK